MGILILFVVGRIIFGIYWLNVGYNHLKHADMLAGYAKSKGIMSGKAAVVGSGILALLGGLSIILGAWPRVGLILIAIFLIGVTFGIHTYWKVTDPQARQMDQVQFNKNMALLGASLLLMSASIPWMWSVI